MKAKKKFGQNFLSDDFILSNITNSINVNRDDLIIEIGPGKGSLTAKLFNLNCYLICYEIDEDMKSFISKFNSVRSEVIFGDFLKTNLEEDIKKYKYNNIHVVANIPYYITSPILFKLLDSEIDFQNIVLLVQKEFADRLCASYKTRDYNALTLYVDFKYNSKILFTVDQKYFNPMPNVDSAVVKLSKKNDIIDLDTEKYFNFIRACFKSKRKTLKNNLSGYNFDKIKNILESIGYKENVRAEEIKKCDFPVLYQKYFEEL